MHRVDDDLAESYLVLRRHFLTALALRFSSQAADERNRRSASVSIRTSRPQSSRQNMDDRYPARSEPGQGLEIVGKKVKLLVDAIEDLRKLGLRALDTVLPELVLVGDQSAGKSSLMGAIAEINLPRATGKCTTCPTNIKTSPAPTWSCTVSLHEYYNYEPNNKRHPFLVTKNQPFGPWTEKDGDLTIRPFTTITHKSELDTVLRCAQHALLNPTSDYTAYIPGFGRHATNPPKDEVGFSPNIISLEISGPRLPALSFYDLPGLFSSAPKPEDQWHVPAFENLAEKYIKHENAIILCAIPMSGDPGNSKSSALISKNKARNRCIGVLTMPDLLPSSGPSEYDGLLEGKTYILPRGYFVTKQPGDDFELQPGADYHVQARQEEADFFETNRRWRNEWSTFRSQCGVDAIQNKLSQEMAQRIASCMPEIEKKIEEQIRIVDEKLSRLPELPADNVQHVVRERLSAFSTGVRRILEGGSSAHEFLSPWGELTVDFRKAIEMMKPKFTISDPSDELNQPTEFIKKPDDIISIASDDEGPVTPVQKKRRLEDGSMSAPVGKHQKVGSIDATPIPFPRMNGEPKPESRASTPVSRRDGPPHTPKRKRTVFDVFMGDGTGFMSLRDLRTQIDRHRGTGLPGHIADAVREEICLQAVTPWDGPLGVLIDQTSRILQSAVLKLLDDTIGGYRQTTLYKNSRHHVLSLLVNLVAEQRQTLETLYKLETYTRFTINDEAFSTYEAQEITLMRAARRKRLATIHINKEARRAGKKLTDEQRQTKLKNIKDEDIPRDQFAKELELAGYVRGYYKTAGLRLADNACQAIRCTLFRKFHEKIPFFLERELEIDSGDSDQQCRSLMHENPADADNRKKYQLEMKKLKEAKGRFSQLAKQYSQDNGPLNSMYDDDEHMGDAYGEDDSQSVGMDLSSSIGSSSRTITSAYRTNGYTPNGVVDLENDD
ncbi:P-loop containing nucleoside triphosphate hydrolase protein [Halenospora varia]|nr:P-loop containing nucleoside triphosphate hydrolase protein [Halenospora varia]